jgi:hypothetical protein
MYPKAACEFEAQAQLYNKLRSLGLNARGEVVVPKQPGQRGCRFDLAVFNSAGTDLLLVIEVKRGPRKRWPWKLAYYRRICGAPVLLCQGTDDVERCLQEVCGLLEEFDDLAA